MKDPGAALDATSTGEDARKCWNCASTKAPCYDGGTAWCVDCGVVDNPSTHPPPQQHPDTRRLEELQELGVDTIYMDDGSIIDVKSGNLRSAIDKRLPEIKAMQAEGQEGKA